MSQHKIIFGDCRSMRELENNSIELVVTSPPYAFIKDYGIDNQIGHKDTLNKKDPMAVEKAYQSYLEDLDMVWRECWRVLKDGCYLVVNVGDQFLRASDYGQYHVLPIHSDITVRCRKIGFSLRDFIIWKKFASFSPTGGGAFMGSYPTPRDGVAKTNQEYIIVLRKSTGKTAPPTDRMDSKLTKEEWKEYFDGTWNIQGERQGKKDGEHIAMFPVELPTRLIRMYSFFGETVLDPFMGSGSTAKAAKELGRDSVGYELNSDYRETMEEKIGDRVEYVYREGI